jgi:hypothetical protein
LLSSREKNKNKTRKEMMQIRSSFVVKKGFMGQDRKYVSGEGETAKAIS